MDRILVISKCTDCPYHDFDNGYDEKKRKEIWGKSWCDKLDCELKTMEIPDECPLSFSKT